jgi:hypothetical protein
MSEDYRSMWTNLGLDLEAHDALLGVLGQAYQDIYLAQKNRPEGDGLFRLCHERSPRAAYQGIAG